MERMVVEFLVEKYGEEVRPSAFIRWSDQCASQFKSRFTLHKLLTAPTSLGLNTPATVVWNYYETGEGKNLSDSIGSIVKAAYQKAVAINRETTARSASEIIELIKTVQKDDMKTFEFLELREIKPFPRPEKNTVKEIKVAGIQKLHSITRLEDGQLVGRKLSCSDCTLGKLCLNCHSLERIYKPGEKNEPESEEKSSIEEGEDEIEVEGDVNAAEDDCESEAGDKNLEDPGSDMEKEDLGPGSVVWVKFRSWYPAEILGVDQLGVKERALPLGQDTVYVKRFGIGDIRLAKIKCLDQLGEDAVDAARASRGSQDMMVAYQLALARLKGEDECV